MMGTDPSQSCHDIAATSADNRDSGGKGALPAAARGRTRRRGVRARVVAVRNVNGAFEVQFPSEALASTRPLERSPPPHNSAGPVLVSAA
jgi:hypothetical protein